MVAIREADVTPQSSDPNNLLERHRGDVCLPIWDRQNPDVRYWLFMGRRRVRQVN